MDLDDFDYDLPERAIAQHPAEPRDAARVAGFWRFALFLAITAGALHLWWSDRLRTLGLVVALAAVTLADLWVVNRNFFETVPPPEVTFAADDHRTGAVKLALEAREIGGVDQARGHFAGSVGDHVVVRHDGVSVESVSSRHCADLDAPAPSRAWRP